MSLVWQTQGRRKIKFLYIVINQFKKHPNRGAFRFGVTRIANGGGALLGGGFLLNGKVLYGYFAEKGDQDNQNTCADGEKSLCVETIEPKTVKDKYGADRQRNNDPTY